MRVSFGAGCAASSQPQFAAQTTTAQGFGMPKLNAGLPADAVRFSGNSAPEESWGRTTAKFVGIVVAAVLGGSLLNVATGNGAEPKESNPSVQEVDPSHSPAAGNP